MLTEYSSDTNNSDYWFGEARLHKAEDYDFLSFNIICLFFILLPLTVLNVAVLVLLQRTSNAKTRTIQLLLCNIPASCLVVSLGLAMYHISGIILEFSENGGSLAACRAIVFIIAVGGQARILFMAFFAFSVFVIVRCREQATCRNFYFFIVMVFALWITSVICSIPVTIEDIVNVTFGDNVSCGPFPTGIGSYLYISFYGIFFGLLAFVFTLTFLLMTISYIRKNTMNAMEGEMNKAILKLGFFLLLGNVLSICGQVVPPMISAFIVTPSRADRGDIGTFLPPLAISTYLLINLSLVPSPILIIVYFNPIREKVKELLFRRCRRDCSCKRRIKPRSPPSSSTVHAVNPLQLPNGPNGRLNSVSTVVDVSIQV